MKRAALLIILLVGIVHLSIFAGERLLLQDGHTGDIGKIVFSPDSGYLATAGDDLTICLWDLKSERLAAVYPLFDEIKDLRFSADGRYFAACSAGKVLLLDIDAVKLSYLEPEVGFSLTTLTFSPDGRSLILGGDEQDICLLDLRTRQIDERFNGENSDYEKISYITTSPDQKRLAGAGSKVYKRTVWRIFLKDIDSGRELTFRAARHKGTVNSLDYSADGSLLLSAGYDGRINIWDTERSGIEFLHILTGSRRYPDARFFPGQSSTFAYLDENEQLRVAQLHRERGEKKIQIVTEIKATVGLPNSRAFSISPDNTLIATANGRTLHLWHGTSYEPVKSYSGDRELFYTLDFSPDGRTVATGGRDIILWNSSTGKKIKLFKNSHNFIYRELFFLNNRQIIARKERFSEGRLFSAVELFDLEKDSSTILPVGTAISISPFKDRSIVVAGTKYKESGNSYYMEIFDLQKSSSICKIEWDRQIDCTAYSPDDWVVAGGDSKGMVRLWETKEGKLIGTLERAEGAITALLFSPNGRVLAFSDSTGRVYLWDMQKEAFLGERRYPGRVISLDFSSDSRRLLASTAYASYISSIDSREKDVVLRGHRSPQQKARFSPDGKRAATVGRDGTMRYWLTEDARHLASLALFPEGYLLYSPEGYYLTGGEKMEERVLWYYKGFYLKEGVGDKLNRPQIIGEILLGKEHGGAERELYRLTGLKSRSPVSSHKGPVDGDIQNDSSSMSVVESKKYAILIGVSDYAELDRRARGGELSDLKYADRDALAFKQFLEAQKRRDGDDWTIECLTNREATGANVDRLLSAILNQAGENDLIYIFFSGHARRHPSTGELYLLPYNFRPEEYRDGLDYRDLNNLIKRSRARYIITFIDACFSGSPGSAKGKNEQLLTAVNSLKLPDNKVVIASSRGEESSYEDERLKQGVFTHYLLKGLQGKAKELNGNNYVELEELLQYLKEKIPAHTMKFFSSPQTPYEFSVDKSIKYNFPLAVRE